MYKPEANLYKIKRMLVGVTQTLRTRPLIVPVLRTLWGYHLTFTLNFKFVLNEF